MAVWTDRGHAIDCDTVGGLVVVTLGESRATNTHEEGSDWDFGAYYRGTIGPDDVRALGWTGQVFAHGAWCRLVDVGAWLQVDGQAVDLIYRHLDEVLRLDRRGRARALRDPAGDRSCVSAASPQTATSVD
jgi:hypothetical protein